MKNMDNSYTRLTNLQSLLSLVKNLREKKGKKRKSFHHAAYLDFQLSLRNFSDIYVLINYSTYK